MPIDDLSLNSIPFSIIWGAKVIFGLTLASNSPSRPNGHTNQWNFGFHVTAGGIHEFCAYWFNLNIKELDRKF